MHWRLISPLCADFHPCTRAGWAVPCVRSLSATADAKAEWEKRLALIEIAAPQTKHAVVHLGNTGKTLEMVANGLSEKAKYVKSVTFNDKLVTDWKLAYADLMAGGKLIFEMEE